MKTCADKLSAGAAGGFGGGRGGNFQAIRDCLTKKGITLAGAFGGRVPGGGGAAAGAGGGAGGATHVTLDPKTQKAMQECQAAAQTATSTTKK